ncbi:hypothetical protein C1645_765900 [Glomus cerebriforme]|uniref:Uncharacterized protein n=1 Tax=Glomus cerebriforme TaxID=658196 RepID=A0A397T182_9GLOM|nr:hypothetical protein C1645_765900 [Glomus cerebriforme]
MTELLSNIPPKSDYKKGSEKVFFSYPGNQNHFQTGYYGVDPNVLIAGTLHLRFPSSDPLLATKIELVFKGFEKVKWTEHHGETTVVYSSKDKFIKQLFQLWTTSDPNENHEKIQNLDIPFEIPLPEDLPPSIKIDSGEGKIRYKLIAKIKRKGNLWKLQGSEKSVELSIDIDKYILPPINLQPSNWEQLNDSEAISRGLGYNITLENSIGGPNMPFIINLMLKFHKQDFKITKIFFGIKEYHKLTTKRKHTRNRKFYLVEKDIKGDEIQLNFNGEVNTQVRLEIPGLNKNNKRSPCWTINDRKHILVRHKIKIKIYCGGMFTSNIKLDNDIQIQNILSEHLSEPHNYNYNEK